MNKLKAMLSTHTLALCLLVVTTGAGASSIEFGYSAPGTGKPSDVHLQSQGQINFDWVSVVGPASLSSEYWGANDIKVFQAIGQSSVAAGQTYTISNGYGVSMWFDAPGLPNILSQDQTAAGYTTWDFSATMRLSSISFGSDGYSMTITGYLGSMVNNLTTTSVLTDLAATNMPSFVLTLTANNRTLAGYDMVTALNSGALSTWTDLDGTVGMVISPPSSVPEPGGMLLLGSAAGLMGWWRRRRGQAAEAQA